MFLNQLVPRSLFRGFGVATPAALCTGTEMSTLQAYTVGGSSIRDDVYKYIYIYIYICVCVYYILAKGNDVWARQRPSPITKIKKKKKITNLDFLFIRRVWPSCWVSLLSRSPCILRGKASAVQCIAAEGCIAYWHGTQVFQGGSKSC